MQSFFKFNIQTKQATLNLKVKAGNKINKIESFILIENKQYLKLNIKAMPKQNKANEEVIKFLSNEWEIIKSRFRDNQRT